MRLATSALRFSTYPYSFCMAVCSTMLSACLVDRRLAYSATCSARVMFSIVIFVTAAQSSAVACSILENYMDISMEFFSVTMIFPPWKEVCCHSCRLACA